MKKERKKKKEERKKIKKERKKEREMADRQNPQVFMRRTARVHDQTHREVFSS